jgi:hypothetical protein
MSFVWMWPEALARVAPQFLETRDQARRIESQAAQCYDGHYVTKHLEFLQARKIFALPGRLIFNQTYS